MRASGCSLRTASEEINRATRRCATNLAALALAGENSVTRASPPVFKPKKPISATERGRMVRPGCAPSNVHLRVATAAASCGFFTATLQ